MGGRHHIFFCQSSKRSLTSNLQKSALCMFVDITARIEYPMSHVTIAPNRFVLMEKTSCELTFKYQPLQEDAVNSQEGDTYTTAHIVIYSGDEVLRKEYRK